MGMAAGVLFNSYKGARNAPKGERIRSALIATRVKAPILGGQFALWGGCFSSFDCMLTAVRRTDDPINSVTAAFLTGGLLAARQGPKPAFASAVMGAVILGVIEGVGYWMTRISQPGMMPAASSSTPYVDPSDKINTNRGSNANSSSRLDEPSDDDEFDF